MFRLIVIGLALSVSVANATFDPWDGDCWRGYAGHMNGNPSNESPQYLANTSYYCVDIIDSETERAKIRSFDEDWFTSVDYDSPNHTYSYLMLQFETPSGFDPDDDTCDLRWNGWVSGGDTIRCKYWTGGEVWEWNMCSPTSYMSGAGSGSGPTPKVEYVEDYFGEDNLFILIYGDSSAAGYDWIKCNIAHLSFNARLGMGSRESSPDEFIYGPVHTGIESASLGEIKAVFK